VRDSAVTPRVVPETAKEEGVPGHDLAELRGIGLAADGLLMWENQGNGSHPWRGAQEAQFI